MAASRVSPGAALVPIQLNRSVSASGFTTRVAVGGRFPGGPEKMKIRSLLVAIAAMASACTVGNAGTVHDRMSKEYNCPWDSITVTTLPGSAYRAEGCGKTATFACGPEGSIPTCTKEAGSSSPSTDAGS